MRYFEISEKALVEKILVSTPLFHYTSLQSLTQIVIFDKIAANVPQLPNGKGENGVSFTRSPQPDPSLFYGKRSQACLIMNSEKIRTAPRFGDDPLSRTGMDRESEERSTANISGVISKLMGVVIVRNNHYPDLSDPDGYAQMKEYSSNFIERYDEMLEICKVENIPVFFIPKFTNGWFIKIKDHLKI